MKDLRIPVALAQAIASYLEERPHREVRSLIDGLLGLRPIEPVADPAMKPGKGGQSDGAAG